MRPKSDPERDTGKSDLQDVGRERTFRVCLPCYCAWKCGWPGCLSSVQGSCVVICVARSEPVTWQMACMGLGCAEGGICCGDAARLACGIGAGQALASSCPEGAGGPQHSL